MKNAPTTIYHYTIDTNHGRHSPASEVQTEVIRPHLVPLLERQHGVYPFPLPELGRYSVEISIRNTGFLATISLLGYPIVEFAVATEPDELADYLWKCILGTSIASEVIQGEPQRPTHYPQILVSVPGSAVFARMPLGEVEAEAVLSDLQVFADFERCLAWTWIEQRNQSSRNRRSSPKASRRKRRRG